MRVVRRCQKYHSRLWVRAGRFPSTGELYSQTSVDIACAMAVCRFNDGTLSLQSIAHRLELETSPFCGERTNDVYKAANIKQPRRLRNCESEREGNGKGCKIKSTRKRDPCTLQGHLITNSQVQASDHVANNL